MMTLLYYYGILQRVVEGIAWVMMKTMRTSGAESLCGAANIFVGQTEAPLFIRPYVPTLTQSELLSVMIGGFATIAAGVMAVYIDFGVPAVHLIAASVMAAPGALVISKLLFPEEGEPETRGSVRAQVERPWVNPVDAAASGAADGVKLAINVAAMLIAFLALLALVNGVLGWVGGLISVPDLSLEWLFARLLAPVAWLLGIAWAEAGRVGVLLGKKTILNEFIAYSDMKMLLDNAKAVAAGTAAAGSVPVLSPRAVVLATYALCGFANIGSIGIQIGGIGPLANGRQSDLAKLGVARSRRRLAHQLRQRLHRRPAALGRARGLRAAARRGCPVSLLHAATDDGAKPLANLGGRRGSADLHQPGIEPRGRYWWGERRVLGE